MFDFRNEQTNHGWNEIKHKEKTSSREETNYSTDFVIKENPSRIKKETIEMNIENHWHRTWTFVRKEKWTKKKTEVKKEEFLYTKRNLANYFSFLFSFFHFHFAVLLLLLFFLLPIRHRHKARVVCIWRCDLFRIFSENHKNLLSMTLLTGCECFEFRRWRLGWEKRQGKQNILITHFAHALIFVCLATDLLMKLSLSCNETKYLQKKKNRQRSFCFIMFSTSNENKTQMQILSFFVCLFGSMCHFLIFRSFFLLFFGVVSVDSKIWFFSFLFCLWWSKFPYFLSSSIFENFVFGLTFFFFFDHFTWRRSVQVRIHSATHQIGYFHVSFIFISI